MDVAFNLCACLCFIPKKQQCCAIYADAKRFSSAKYQKHKGLQPYQQRGQTKNIMREQEIGEEVAKGFCYINGWYIGAIHQTGAAL